MSHPRRKSARVAPISGDLSSRSARVAQSDLRIAKALSALGQTTPCVELAIQLLVRGLRLGHVCVDLETVQAQLQPSPNVQAKQGTATQTDPDEGWGEFDPDLPWLAPEPWRAELLASSLVREAADTSTTPLVLDGHRLYLDRMFQYETGLAELASARAELVHPVANAEVLRERLDALFGAQQDQPLDRQRLGAALASLRSLTVIAGGPGTGKTTTVKKLLLLLLAQNEGPGLDATQARAEPLRIALAAPTGKAAARLREALTEGLDDIDAPQSQRATLRALEASTVHRLLGPRADSRSRFRHDASTPLPFDVVVVDEASMIPLSLMTKLFEACAPATKLVLLGDPKQLASIEAGAVLGDMCGPAAGAINLSEPGLDELAALDPALCDAVAEVCELPPRARGIWDCIVTLDRVHRFDPKRGIGQLARALQLSPPQDPAAAALKILRDVRDPNQPGAGAYADLRWLDCPLPSSEALGELKSICLEAFVPLVKGARAGVPAAQLLEMVDRLRILCAHRQGPAGVEELGAQVEAWLSQAEPDYDPAHPWPLGRPLLVTENDHELGLYNGDVGLIVRHPERAARPCVAFPDARAPGGVRFVNPSRLPRNEAVFTMSIHKSQGSQFAHAVVVLPRRMSLVCTRELVYTAITRARQALTIAASPQVLRSCLQRTVERGSGLQARLW